MRVDLNADMGEGFGDWSMGDDEALLDIVTSANVACGAHAGDWDVMARTMTRARDRGVGIGAHPGFPDLQGFGRRRMAMPSASVANLVIWQFGAARGMAASLGTKVRHFKLHGALANMASEDVALAAAAYKAALRVDPEVILLVLAGTAQEAAATELGARWAGEIFADRGYNDDATLVARGQPGAMVHDPQEAAARMVEFVKGGAIVANSGRAIPAACDSICLHGDGPEAVGIARAVRTALEAANVTLTPMVGRGR
ncbi:LamB/YcsF family protein [Jannaschia donghaensis]|uniref:5-oxoprolinase subunit A n=1 Tax=Jannaschia donghaensis TaxID=420998 RepID=A0A0M6YKE0_9RHOB|nr:5-oxoprolinase subunit PxpA [Jannaschia donghaensis]CTQ50279.1 LamB/YcsF family protein [Jannaschia donghaensis]